MYINNSIKPRYKFKKILKIEQKSCKTLNNYIHSLEFYNKTYETLGRNYKNNH